MEKNNLYNPEYTLYNFCLFKQSFLGKVNLTFDVFIYELYNLYSSEYILYNFYIINKTIYGRFYIIIIYFSVYSKVVSSLNSYLNKQKLYK